MAHNTINPRRAENISMTRPPNDLVIASVAKRWDKSIERSRKTAGKVAA
jgi:hypothetical protein